MSNAEHALQRDPEPDAETDKVWLITGCSSGMGREFALEALRAGYRVVATARKPSTLEDIVELFPERARAIELDVTRPEQIERALANTLSEFGRLDVLVNNAAYGYLAAIEEGEESAIRALFETNLFGTLAMTRSVLPHMRERRCGHIIHNSSQAGLMSRPGTGYYSMTKYAVEALNEALAEEVAPFGIKVTAIEAGPFRTRWAGSSIQRTAHPIAAYAETVHERADLIAEMDGRQPGDPVRAARALVALVRCENPPLQLLMGRIALDAYREKLDRVKAALDEWEEVTIGTDFPTA